LGGLIDRRRRVFLKWAGGAGRGLSFYGKYGIIWEMSFADAGGQARDGKSQFMWRARGK